MLHRLHRMPRTPWVWWQWSTQRCLSWPHIWHLCSHASRRASCSCLVIRYRLQRFAACLFLLLTAYAAAPSAPASSAGGGSDGVAGGGWSGGIGGAGGGTRYPAASMSNESAQSFIRVLNGSTIPAPTRLLKIGPSVCTLICICSTRVALFGLRALPASTRNRNSRVSDTISLREIIWPHAIAPSGPSTAATSSC